MEVDPFVPPPGAYCAPAREELVLRGALSSKTSRCPDMAPVNAPTAAPVPALEGEEGGWRLVLDWGGLLGDP